ncbi:MAG: UDP-3-O-acyl-N-acetylglucosamine deacetylase [Deltaproteobacteria bacterium]|nr:UDP-3-O-acyl-N-acetylglucosamine deacetylase [Deltaproteobacteria bacterium]
MHQKTIRAACHIKGVGLHTGENTAITLLPAAENTGVVFAAVSQGRRVNIPARQENVVRTTMSTTMGREGVEIWTVEHLMSALTGLEIDNVLIVVEGPEIPAMDGSALPFVSRIMEVGRMLQAAPRSYMKILKPVVVEDGERVAGLFPSNAITYSFMIEFSHSAIRTQSFKVHLNAQSFVAQLAKARTFGFQDDVDLLKSKGLARGAGLENAVGLSAQGTVLNPEGLRYADEFVRHKLLDAVGDISLAGYPILGEYRGIKSGHEMNLRLLKELNSRPDSWEMITSDTTDTAQAV